MPKLLFATTISLSARFFLLPLARHFRALGWQVDAAASGISQCDACRQGFDHVWEMGWSRNPLAPENLRTVPGVFEELVRRGEYDIVHVHTPVAAFVGRFALRKLRSQRSCKVIYTAHGFHFHPTGGRVRNRIFSSLEKIAGRWTDHLVTINQIDYDAAMGLGLVGPDRLHLMPGIGVNTQSLRTENVTDEDVQKVRTELGLTPQTPLFTMAAEFIPRKRHRDLLLAFSRMKNQVAHLALAGSGVLQSKMERLAERLGIRARVHFLGFRRDLPALFRASNASVLCSEQEGLPLAVMESLTLGTPVIGSRIRGTSDLLCNGAGLLIETGRVAQLSDALDWMIKNSSEAKLMGKIGAQQSARYDVASVIQMHEKLYRAALLQ